MRPTLKKKGINKFNVMQFKDTFHQSDIGTPSQHNQIQFKFYRRFKKHKETVMQKVVDIQIENIYSFLIKINYSRLNEGRYSENQSFRNVLELNRKSSFYKQSQRIS